MDAISEIILEILNKPNPDIKIQLNLFLYRNIKQMNAADASKKYFKDFIFVLIKVIDFFLFKNIKNVFLAY